jgi:hypothetical protein
MKKTFLILSLLAVSFSSASAATLFADNGSSGFTLADGTTALANGRLRFGIFTITNAQITSNADNLTYLNNNFREVVNYSGAINAYGGLNGFFDGETLGATKTYAGGNTVYGGTPYDLSASALNGTNDGDIAGENIYLWVLNNSDVSAATQHGIFVNNANVWTDSQAFPVSDSFFDVAPANTQALVGALNGGTDIGAAAPSHKLATIGAIPEPSRALLMFLGLGGFFLRRRRA